MANETFRSPKTCAACANLGIGVLEQTRDRQDRLRLVLDDLTKPPNRVKPGELSDIALRDSHERVGCQIGIGIHVFHERIDRRFGDERELRTLSNAHVFMTDQIRQRVDREVIESAREQRLDFMNLRIADSVLVEDLVQTAFVRFVPAFDPIADIKCAVGAEIDVGREQGPKKLFRIDDLERRSFRLDREASDAALTAASAEIGQEEVLAHILGKKRHAGIIRQSRRAVADVHQRRQEIKRGVRGQGMPKFLGVPDASAVGFLDELIADPPTAVSPFDEMDPARPGRRRRSCCRR